MKKYKIGMVLVNNSFSGQNYLPLSLGFLVSYADFHCRNFDDFVSAIENINQGKISSKKCREIGEKYSLENIAPRYEDFFRRIMDVQKRDGWYQRNTNKFTELED